MENATASSVTAKQYSSNKVVFNILFNSLPLDLVHTILHCDRKESITNWKMQPADDFFNVWETKRLCTYQNVRNTKFVVYIFKYYFNVRIGYINIKIKGKGAIYSNIYAIRNRKRNSVKNWKIQAENFGR